MMNPTTKTPVSAFLTMKGGTNEDSRNFLYPVVVLNSKVSKLFFSRSETYFFFTGLDSKGAQSDF